MNKSSQTPTKEKPDDTSKSLTLREIGDNVEDSVDFSSQKNLSEDVQNMEVDVDVEAPGGLLSSSILDKASDISERCASSLSQRSSLGVEASFDLGCPSSLSESRRSSLLSSGAEPHEKDKNLEFRRSTPEPLTETVPDSLFIPDQRSQMKPDTLSKKDRLLIHKIRRYYEHAEHQDASFAVKRRESLSYIPAGLVRNLSQQLDYLADQDLALHKRASSITSSDFLVPANEKKAETSKVSLDSGLGEPLVILEESDESSTSPPINIVLEKDKMQEFQRHPKEEHKLQEQHKVNHPPLPKIISLRSASEDELILQDMEKMKNKVFQLARHYSQRIKNNRPVVRQRPKILENHFLPKNLSSVMEERPPGKEKGIPDKPLLLNLNEQDLIPDSTTTSPPSSLCSPGSPQFLNCRLYAQRPQSPVQTETFHWPDVKELRSKYNSQRQDDASTSPRPFPVGRSTSFSERALETESERSGASCSWSCSSPFCNITVQRTTSIDSTCSSKTIEGEGLPSLCRVNAFDFGLGSTNAHEQLERGCDAGQDENNLIVVERICKAKHEEDDLAMVSQSEFAMANSKEHNFSEWMEKAENSQHSLVKNLRDKFQNLNSYT
uniref:Uncharacterized protein n=1 Tax=Sinocyclocheilus grahami TaxID=75366 RepID=A0A672KFU4_SINGR